MLRFFMRDIDFPKYKKWNIIDLFDYLTDYYFDMAQEDPEHYAARVPMQWYDLEDPIDVDWLTTYCKETDGIWYYTDDVLHTDYVSTFKHLTAMWRSDLPQNGKYKIQYMSPQRNDYILSSEAFRQILKERYADFYFLTSFTYDYKTQKRKHCETLEEAGNKLLDTLRVFKHDKQDPLTKLMFALRQDYNPIENYSKISEIITQYIGSEFDKFKPKGSETNELSKTGSETNALTKAGKEKTSIVNGARENTVAKIPYDGANSDWKNTDRSSDASSSDSSELEYGSSGSTRTDTNVNTYTNRKDTNTLSYDNSREDINWKKYGQTEDGTSDPRKDIITENMHGNIGVTTTQKMLLSQFSIEWYDEIEHYTVSEFATKYLVTQ